MQPPELIRLPRFLGRLHLDRPDFLLELSDHLQLFPYHLRRLLLTAHHRLPESLEHLLLLTYQMSRRLVDHGSEHSLHERRVVARRVFQHLRFPDPVGQLTLTFISSTGRCCGYISPFTNRLRLFLQLFLQLCSRLYGSRGPARRCGGTPTMHHDHVASRVHFAAKSLTAAPAPTLP
ncbi:hypothetical protein Forpi1262_v015385 [Fusarium oxysporum f. sp. raphani]|uniref:Uncharacterized protein n=1 Tax=Fusarium oxysporum f. sp. raphani TaxID=96318 RepID=A0A8J5U2A3_FUSOX|nr:hypothetical protein Forpi1262_v015385 [Fusarium oxysporum f. sp. raphani]